MIHCLAKGLLGFLVLPLIHVAVSVKEVSGGSFCDTLRSSDPVLDGNLVTFYSCIQGPNDPLEYIISVVLSYLQTSFK